MEKYTYFWVCIIIIVNIQILHLNLFSKTTHFPFKETILEMFMKSNWYNLWSAIL